MTNPAIVWGYQFSTQPVLRVDVNGAGAEDVILGTAVGTTYFVTGDGSSSDLLALLDTAIESHSVGPTATSTLTAARLVRTAVSGLGVSVQLLWSHANTTLGPAVVGWTSADSSAAGTITSPNEHGGLWLPGKPPETDTGDQVPVVGGATTALSGLQRTSYFGQPYATRDMNFGLIAPEHAVTRFATSTAPKAPYEAAWLDSSGQGWPMRYAPDAADLTTYTEYVLREPSKRPFERDARFPAQRYAVSLALRRTS